MVRNFVIATAIALSGASSAVAGGPFGNIHVEDWKGGAFTDDSTGAFLFCAAIRDFSNGYGVILGQNNSQIWILGFTNNSGNFPVATHYTIELSFDGEARFKVFAKAVSKKTVAGPLTETAANRFAKSHVMVATWNGQTLRFDLSAVDRLPRLISSCVEKARNSGVSGPGNIPGAAAKSSAADAASKSAEPPSETTQPKQSKYTQVSGTGFAISAKGHVVTNNHVISRCVGDIHGNLTGDAPTSLRIVSTDETNDLALLETKIAFKDMVRIRSTPVRSGDTVVAIGFPLHGLLTSDFTVTTGIVNSLSGILNDSRFLQISAEVHPGNSGGPLLDTSGNLVGVVSEKLNALRFAKLTGDIPQNINFAIKTGAVRDFLDNSAVPYVTAESRAELKNSEVAEHARDYTMLIGCTAAAEDAVKR